MAPPLDPRRFVEYLLPHLLVAGRYSREIQSRVASRDAKPGMTAFDTALSDADLTVQSYLEVALLTHGPALSYFSEEQEQSLNAKYFAADAEYEVLLDPIDGTRLYLDNQDGYQIIVTLHDRRSIAAAICYMPRLERCYFALRGEGAFMMTNGEILSDKAWKPFKIKPRGGPVLLYNNPTLKRKIEPHFSVLDVVELYAKSPGRYKFTDIFAGSLTASMHAPAQLIDAGAIAFIAQEAGAAVSDFAGKPMESYRAYGDRKAPNLLVALTEDIRQRICLILAEDSPKKSE